MISVPAELARLFGITPGCKLDWEPGAKKKEIRVRVIPKRGDLARELRGGGLNYSPQRRAVEELLEERALEG
jgi:hypothetical protein